MGAKSKNVVTAKPTRTVVNRVLLRDVRQLIEDA